MDGTLTAEISAGAIRENLALLRGRLARGVKLCAVVKCDAYGLGIQHALSALIGGGIGAFSSLVMVLFVFRGGGEKSPGELIRGVYVGEFFKLILTVGLFIAVIVYVDVAILPLLIGYAATFDVYWAALLKAMPKVLGPGG